MTELEKLYIQERNDKYGMGKLGYRLVHDRDALPESLDGSSAVPQEHYKRKMQDYKEHFGIDYLPFKGVLGLRLERARTLEQASMADAKARVRDTELKVATANYQGKPVRFWLNVSKVKLSQLQRENMDYHLRP